MKATSTGPSVGNGPRLATEWLDRLVDGAVIPPHVGDPGLLALTRKQMIYAQPVGWPPLTRKSRIHPDLNRHSYLKRATWKSREKFEIHHLASCPE
jgi:hypothetical protein